MHLATCLQFNVRRMQQSIPVIAKLMEADLQLKHVLSLLRPIYKGVLGRQINEQVSYLVDEPVVPLSTELQRRPVLSLWIQYEPSNLAIQVLDPLKHDHKLAE